MFSKNRSIKSNQHNHYQYPFHHVFIETDGGNNNAKVDYEDNGDVTDICPDGDDDDDKHDDGDHEVDKLYDMHFTP